MHRATLTVAETANAASKLGHDAFGIHATRDHMAMVAIRRDHRIALLGRMLHPDDDRFLPDVKVAKAADKTHAIELARFFLEAADAEHLAIHLDEFLFGQARSSGRFLRCIDRFQGLRFGRRGFGSSRHKGSLVSI